MIECQKLIADKNGGKWFDNTGQTKISVLLFTTISPLSLAKELFIIFYMYDYSTYRFAVLVKRRNRKHGKAGNVKTIKKIKVQRK